MSSILIRRANIINGGSGPVPIDYSTRYLTFEASEAGTFSLIIPAAITSANLTSVSYSTDNGSTWITTNNDDTDITITTPTIQVGGKVLWKGTGTKYSNSSVYSNFSSTGNFVISGNSMSLIYGDNFATKTSLNSATYIFKGIFRDCSKLTSAENFILPATTATSYCYQNMFYKCTSLVSPPKIIPFTKVVQGSCNNMFSRCSSLTTAPELPATTLGGSSYGFMFLNCTSLVKAPDLPAATLVSYSYQTMFDGCSSLNYIKCLATDKSATGCTTNWVRGVAATGTFVKASSMSGWGTGNSGIPSGWTVVDA